MEGGLFPAMIQPRQDIGFVPEQRGGMSTASADELQGEVALSALAGHIRGRWVRAVSSKQKLHTEMLRCLRQRLGRYDPDVLAAIRETGGSEIFIQLTDIKCRAAAAWMRDVMMPADEEAWGIEPTPVVELPPELVQMAAVEVQRRAMMAFQETGSIDESAIKEALERATEAMRERLQERAGRIADAMEQRMRDETEQGEWRTALSEWIDDFVTYPFAVLKGPVMRRRKRLRWAQWAIAGNASSTPIVEEQVVRTFERRSPFDLYFSPGMRNIQRGGYLFDRHRFTVQQLNDLSEDDGFSKTMLEAAIAAYGETGFREAMVNDSERDILEGFSSGQEVADMETVDALNYWGRATGRQLRQFDPKGDFIDEDVEPTKSYEVEAWQIGKYTVKAILNPDPLGERPYGLSSYIKTPGTMIGRGIPQAVRDDQQACNGAGRSMMNNMGIASGPQVVLTDASRIPQGQPLTTMFPWKLWVFNQDERPQGGHRPPMEFYQPNPMVEALLAVFEHFSRQADEHASLPAYIYGGTERVEGAGSTASGLAMLMGQASKSMKLVVGNIDKDVIEPTIRRLYYSLMLFDEDPSIKGDLIVKARGSSALLVREQRQLRLNDFLAIVGSNEVALSIIGREGFARLLREVGKDMLDIPIDDVVPDPKTMKAQQVQQQGPSPEQVQAEADKEKQQVEAQLRQQEMQLTDQRENRKIDLENTRKNRELDLKAEELAQRAQDKAQAREDAAMGRATEAQTNEVPTLAAENDDLLGQLDAMAGAPTGSPPAAAGQRRPQPAATTSRDAGQPAGEKAPAPPAEGAPPAEKAQEANDAAKQVIDEVMKRLDQSQQSSEAQAKALDERINLLTQQLGREPVVVYAGGGNKRFRVTRGKDGKMTGGEVTEVEDEDQ